MNVFVTAGTGFVGRAVCEELIRKGNQVTALVRSPQKAQDLVTLGATIVVGDMLKPETYYTLQKGQLRVFGKGNNYWSPVHVADLASAYALAAAGTYYGENFNVVDDQPITLRQMVDLLTEQQGVKKVGNVPAWLIGWLIGGELVKSLTCSFRVRNDKAKRVLNWQPTYNSFALGVPKVLEQLNNAKS